MSTRRPRVLQVLEATQGGTRRHLRELALALSSRDIDLCIVCAVRRDPTFQDDIELFRQLGHAVLVLPMTRGLNPLRDLQSILLLRKLLRSQAFDLVHLHSAKAGFVGRLAAFGVKCKVIYSPHAFPFLQRAPFPLRQLFSLTERVLSFRTDLLLAVSEAEGRLAVEDGLFTVEHVQVLPNAVNSEALELRVRPAPIRPGDEITFSLLGELRPQKDPLTFLEAACHLRAKNLPARFIIPGRGRDLPAVRRYLRLHGLEEHVELIPCEGSLDTLLRRTDIGVLPSLWEGLPYALLDAMALRRPVIASRLPVFEDLLSPLDERLLFPCGDSQALAERMELWARLPRAELEVVGERSRRLVEERYDHLGWERDLYHIYDSLLARPGAGARQ